MLFRCKAVLKLIKLLVLQKVNRMNACIWARCRWFRHCLSCYFSYLREWCNPKFLFTYSPYSEFPHCPSSVLYSCESFCLSVLDPGPTEDCTILFRCPVFFILVRLAQLPYLSFSVLSCLFFFFMTLTSSNDLGLLFCRMSHTLDSLVTSHYC